MVQDRLVTINSTNEKVLRTPAKTVEFPLDSEAKECAVSLQDIFTQLSSPYSKPAGLAATQIGYSFRMFMFQLSATAKDRRKYVEGPPWEPTLLINPHYEPIKQKGKIKDWEACYSVPNLMGEVWRYRSVHLTAMTLEGEAFDLIASGHLAVVFQHEIDHLQGILYTDLISEDCRVGPMTQYAMIREQEFEEWKKT